MYKYLFSILLVLLSGQLLAQRDTPGTNRRAVQPPVKKSIPPKNTVTTDSPRQTRTPQPRRTVTPVKQVVRKDSSAGVRLAAKPAAKKDTAALRGATALQAEKPADSAWPPSASLALRNWERDTLFRRILNVPYLPVKARPVAMFAEEHVPENKDALFYLLVGIVLFLAFIRVSFTKFFQNTFRLFFQSSFRQKQGREQLSQDNLPSLLMNLLFVMVAGLFITVVASQKNWVPVSFWWLLLYSTLVLLGIYLVKYLFIRFAGWVFNVQDAADTYSFIVFLVNKIAAVALIPLLMVAAFSGGQVNDIVLTITGCLVGILLLYRYAVSLGAVRKSLQVNAFHFFLYLCAVEIIPLLLIYKVLFNKIGFSI
jgi:hypothetical protein